MALTKVWLVLLLQCTFDNFKFIANKMMSHDKSLGWQKQKTKLTLKCPNKDIVEKSIL